MPAGTPLSLVLQNGISLAPIQIKSRTEVRLFQATADYIQ